MRSDLDVKTGLYALDVKLPPGMTATVVLPTVGGKTLTVGSGVHHFTGQVATQIGKQERKVLE